MLEFTGERVIPGLVDSNLFNEHLARYRFAARFCQGAAVLDAASGSGYGAAEITSAASVIGIDYSWEVVRYASEHFAGPRTSFLQGRCEALPFGDRSFDVVLAFEIIEHLDDWQKFLGEIQRVLKPGGKLFISTPNKAYYAESRATAGPNPFHRHEFDADEFESALMRSFAYTRIWTQNHAEALIFATRSPAAGTIDHSPVWSREDAHFVFAACSQNPIAINENFAYFPTTANVLREREQHIALLSTELEQKDRWLGDLEKRHFELQKAHEGLLAEFDEEIGKLRRELDSVHRGYAAQRAELERELDNVHRGYDKKIAELEADCTARFAWGKEWEARAGAALAELAEVKAALRVIDSSAWMRLGRRLHLGPAGDGV